MGPGRDAEAVEQAVVDHILPRHHEHGVEVPGRLLQHRDLVGVQHIGRGFVPVGCAGGCVPGEPQGLDLSLPVASRHKVYPPHLFAAAFATKAGGGPAEPAAADSPGRRADRSTAEAEEAEEVAPASGVSLAGSAVIRGIPVRGLSAVGSPVRIAATCEGGGRNCKYRGQPGSRESHRDPPCAFRRAWQARTRTASLPARAAGATFRPP